MSLPVLQELLGHESLDATQRYYQISEARIKREFFASMEYVTKLSVASVAASASGDTAHGNARQPY